MNHRGVALPVVLMVLGVLSMMGAAAIAIALGELRSSHKETQYKSALDLAEAGLADAADGIEGNRRLLPRPLGSIDGNSYAFDVSVGDTGKYTVTVSLPLVAQVTSGWNRMAPGPCTIRVDRPVHLSVSDTVVVGDVSTRMTAIVGAVRNDEITLVRARGSDLPPSGSIEQGMFISKNLVEIRSTGEVGRGLTASYTLDSWRKADNPFTPGFAAGSGKVLSRATVISTFLPQEISVFDSLSLNVATTKGNSFSGPVFAGRSLTLPPNASKSFSGPVFANAYADVSPGSGLKVVTVSSPRISSAAELLAATAESPCSPERCDPKGASQIYYIFGYEIRVAAPGGIDHPPAPPTDSGGLRINSISPNFLAATPADIKINVTVSGNAGNGSDATYRFFLGYSPLNISSISSESGDYWVAGGRDLKIRGGNTPGSFDVFLSLPVGAASGYITGVRDSDGKVTNGQWLSVGAQGAVVSSELQRDEGGYHSHARVLKPLPPLRSNWTGQVTDTQNKDGRAVLFGGKDVSALGPADIGSSSEYVTKYFIHTHTSTCGDNDMIISSRTVVTYMGVRKTKGRDGCSLPEQRHLFLYETVWDHTPGGPNQGLQPDDFEALGLPHKGYYKWVKTVAAGSREESSPLTADPQMGDQEFNSVFNHSGGNNFHSAVVQWNISQVRLVGWSNPPVVRSGSTMAVMPQPFPRADWLNDPARAAVGDDEISGNYSALGPGVFSGINLTYYTDSSGYPYLPDAATINPGRAEMLLYRADSVSPDAGSSWTVSRFPGLNSTSPLMPENLAVKPTVITATNKGPLTRFEVIPGEGSLSFGAANGMAFNVGYLRILSSKSETFHIAIGSPAEPAVMLAGGMEARGEGCGRIDLSLWGKVVAGEAILSKQVQYNISSDTGTGGQCLGHGGEFIFLKRLSWQEIRN